MPQRKIINNSKKMRLLTTVALIWTFAIVAFSVAYAGDRKLEYVGDGRYTCRGDCDRFNADNRRYNRLRSDNQLADIEAKEAQRQYELDRELERIDREHKNR